MVAEQAAVTLEDICRDAMAPDLGARERQAWVDDALACMRRHGALVIRNAIPSQVIAAVNDEFRVRHEVHMAPGQKRLYRRFQSDPLRAQVPTAVSGPVADPAFFAPPSVLALARELVGEDFIIGDMGVVISHGGAADQEAHRDSSPLFDGLEMDLDLPMFCLMVLVPLVDVKAEMGPTEYWPGSHLIRDKDRAMAAPPLRIPVEAGTVCLHDSRLVHRGAATGPGLSDRFSISAFTGTGTSTTTASPTSRRSASMNPCCGGCLKSTGGGFAGRSISIASRASRNSCVCGRVASAWA